MMLKTMFHAHAVMTHLFQKLLRKIYKKHLRTANAVLYFFMKQGSDVKHQVLTLISVLIRMIPKDH